MSETCYVCNSPLHKTYTDSSDFFFVDCYRCGEYKINSFAPAWNLFKQLNKRQIANLSGWIRENQGVKIYQDDYDRLFKIETPTVGEKAEKFIKYLVKKYSSPGETMAIEYNAIKDLLSLINNNDQFHDNEKMMNLAKKQLPLLSIAWAIDQNELDYIFKDYLIKNMLFIDAEAKKITPKGWEYIEKIRLANNSESHFAFIAMWFDEEHFQSLFPQIEKAVNQSGYKAIPVNYHEHNNDINDEIISLIRRSKFVIADFTKQRGGVYFESGFAKGIGLNVIWTCDISDKDNIHFDTNHYNFIFWDNNNFSEFVNKLQNRIEATIGKGPIKIDF